MRKLLTLLLCLLVTPVSAQSWIANAPNQSIPFNNNGQLGYINWVNGCILQYQTGTSVGAMGGYPACLTTLPAGIVPSYPSQAANTFFASPAGSSGAPAFRPISATDLGAGTLSPTFSTLYATNLGSSATPITTANANAVSSGTGSSLALSAPGCQNVTIGVNGTTPWIFGCTGSFNADGDNTRTLGSSTVRWSTGYFVNLGTSGTPVTNGYFSSITTASTTGVTTGTNAAAGAVGEYATSTVLLGSAVSLVSGVAKDITSISLTAGDWDCEGETAYNNGASTAVAAQYGWISTTSATLPTVPNSGAFAGPTLSTPQTGTFGLGYISTGRFRVNVSATTPVYLSTYVSFTISTSTAYGFLGCRRMR